MAHKSPASKAVEDDASELHRLRVEVTLLQGKKKRDVELRIEQLEAARLAGGGASPLHAGSVEPSSPKPRRASESDEQPSAKKKRGRPSKSHVSDATVANDLNDSGATATPGSARGVKAASQDDADAAALLLAVSSPGDDDPSTKLPGFTVGQVRHLEFTCTHWFADAPEIKKTDCDEIWVPRMCLELGEKLESLTAAKRVALRDYTLKWLGSKVSSGSQQRLRWLATFYYNHTDENLMLMRAMPPRRRHKEPKWHEMRSFLAQTVIQTPLRLCPSQAQIDRIDNTFDEYCRATEDERKWQKLKQRLQSQWHRCGMGATWMDIPLGTIGVVVPLEPEEIPPAPDA